MSEAHEIAEKITEANEHDHTAKPHLNEQEFRKRMGTVIGFLACGLAITSVGGSKAMQETINANIESSDDYAFYQFKVLRKEVVQTASEELDSLVESVPSLPDEAKTNIRQRQDAYAKQMAHWDSAPKEGNGIKELLEKAEASKGRRESAAERNEWFEFAEAMLQISVVIASTSVLLASRKLAIVCAVLAAAGGICSFNGYFNLIRVPFF